MNTKIFIGLAACLFFFACNQASSDYAESSTSQSAPKEEALNFESNADSARTVIKTADIKLNVKNVEQEIQSFQDKVNALNGHVFHYEINNNRSLEKEYQQSLDSSYQIYKVEPIGFMKVKVPVSQTDAFVQFVLSKNGVIEHFSLDEQDVTEDLQEKKELVNMDVNTAVKKQTIASNNYDKTTKEEKIKLKTDFKKLAYKTNFLWFDIAMNGNSFMDKQKIASSKNYRTPFYVNALKALDNGWYLFSQLLVGLMNLWPFILVTILVLIFLKRKNVIFKNTLK